MNQAKGYVFVCSNETVEECFRLRLFGTTEDYRSKVIGIEKGNILFLYNLDSGQLFGVFEAGSKCIKNIVPHA